MSALLPNYGKELPRIDAVMNADNELALVTDDLGLQALTAISYRRRDGQLLGHEADGTRPLGNLAKPMIGRLQGTSEVLLVIEQADQPPYEKTLTLLRHP